MDRVVERLFSPLCNDNYDAIHSVADLEREVLEFSKHQHHSAIIGDSSKEGRRLVYMKLLDVTENAAGSLLYPQGLAVEEFDTGAYTERQVYTGKNLSSFLLTYTLCGDGQLSYGGKKYSLTTGEGFVIDSGLPHRYECTGERWKYVLVHFSGATAHTYMRRIEAAGAVKYRFLSDSAYTADFKSLFSLYMKEREMQDVHSAFLLTSMLTHILLPAEDRDSASRVSPDMAAIQTYITENYADTLTLDLLAARFNLSKYRLAHAFKDRPH